MASKRAMYRVVSTKQDKSAPNRRRKPLIQGRLVTTKDPDPRPKVVDPLLQGEEVLTVAHSPKQSKITTPRRHLGSRAKVEDSYTSPRRDTPSVSLQQSPRPVAPSQSLELSDSEIEFNIRNNESGGFSQALTEVMLVDALGQTQDADTSEVNISLGMSKSPVRVICHSNSPVVSRVHGTGSVEQAAKVAVDPLPHYEIGSSSDAHTTDRVGTYSPEDDVMSARHRTAGSPRHHKSIVKSLFAGSAAEDSDGDSCVVIPTGQAAAGDCSSPGSNDSRNMTREHSISATNSAVKGKTPKAGSAKKRQKNGQVIPSRYMQAASKVAAKNAAASAKGPMKATDRSIMERSKFNRSDVSILAPKRTGGSSFLAPKLTGGTQGRSTSLLLPKRTGEVVRKPRGPGSAKKTRSTSAASTTRDSSRRNKHVSGGAQFSTTPEAHGKGGQASTPTGEPPIHSVDVSAITVHSSIMSTPESLDMTRDLPGHSTPPPRTNMSLDSKPSHDQKPVEITQGHLDLLQSRYLQWVYLNHVAERAFKEQERNAMSQVYELWLENERLRQRKFELQSQHGKLRHINQLDDALEKQSSGLKDVVSGLSQVQQQYNSLVTALDTTRHQIPTRGIHIPDEEDQFHDSLLHALGESEQLLGELSIMIQAKEPKVTNYATSISATHKTVETEVKELSKCQELLSAASALTLQETSLMIQDSQIDAD